jgi:diguanylate cyclase (GGDEF)-like protein/PAS domain S-box-containing protein
MAREEPLKILYIGTDATSIEKIRYALREPETSEFELIKASTLSEGIERANQEKIAAALLQFGTHDNLGGDSLEFFCSAAPKVPVLILLKDGQEALAAEALKRGGVDYLLPRHLDSYSLSRALTNVAKCAHVGEESFAEKDRALVTLNSIGDAVLCTDNSGRVTYLNTVAEGLLGWRREDAIGLELTQVFHIVDGVTRKPSPDPMKLAIQEDKTVGLGADCVLVRQDGCEFAIADSTAPIHDQSGQCVGAVMVFHDVTEARATALQMSYAAQHDIVTDLPNRLLLNDRISQAISLARRQNRPIAVMFLDLDHFKYINDALGHGVGDKLLQSVAKRLVANLRSSDTVSRQGGDEFVILLPDIVHSADAAASAKNLLHSLREPHDIGGQSLVIDGSIGISIYPTDGLDAETLIQNADTAMYHVKTEGRNDCQFFKESMNMKVVERQALEAGIRRGLERKEFFLHYQPMVRLSTREITGVEALIRWESPDRGFVPPSEFIPVAEDSGLIVQMGRWVLHSACEQARAWQDAGLPPVPISVNVSALEFRHLGFIDGVQAALSETGLAARYLVLELTEGVLMEDVESTVSLLSQLKSLGVHLAVDDFGTGFSSLSYLRQFPIDVLKIDISFVREIGPVQTDSAILSAIINMGNSLKYRVIAEGIEIDKQRAYLLDKQCAEGQGYLFSPPLPAPQLVDLFLSEPLGQRSRKMAGSGNSPRYDS